MKRLILFSLILFLTTFHAWSQDYSTYTACAEQDSLALVALYNSADGPNWKCNQDGFSLVSLSDDVLTYHSIDHPNAGMGKWLVGPVKDWYGVLLEKQPVGTTKDSVWRVIHVGPTVSRRQAGDNNMKGYIPREVGFLTALKWFKVNGNGGLQGSELPKEIFHPSLTDIDVEAVYLEGEVSSEMRKCTDLWFPNFRYNLFDTIPVFDFLTPDITLSHFSGSTVFFYNNRFTYSNIESSVEYWLTFSTSKQIKYEARQQHDIGQEKEMIVKPGDKVVLTSNVGGKNGGYTWYKKGFNTYLTGSSYTINNIAAKDTGDYKVLVTNELVRLNDQNSDYSNVFSSPIHVRFTPSAPQLKKMETSYNGTEIALTFTKKMAASSKAQASEFVVTSGGITIPVADVVLGGRFSEKLILKLATPAISGEEVTVSYNKGTVVCSNNGALESFAGKIALNMTRIAPNVVKAVTRDDGSGIFVTFDHFVDPTTLLVSDFTVLANGINQTISSVMLKNGEINTDVTKTIELVLSENRTLSDAITVSYKRGSLAALYGALVPSFSDLKVENIIIENRTTVLLRVEDGTKKMDGVAVKGNMKSLPFSLYDDGTNGDVTANDNIWSKSLELSDGEYTWEAYERQTTISYDTVTTVGADGTITQVITPKELNNDILITAGEILAFSVVTKTITGETFYGYRNNSLTFILNMTGYQGSSEIAPFLMGINNDWTSGVEMKLLSGNDWTATVGGFSLGESVSFNFRNGKDWENNSPVMRTHTVAGNETLYFSFGNMTSTQESFTSQKLKVYPNPTDEILNISIPNNSLTSELTVYDISGRKMIVQNKISSVIDVRILTKGTYIIHAKSVEGETYQSYFLKK
jgi:uncharacterized repeat protein (TIGR02059 family)